jgi:hypothetical protein
MERKAIIIVVRKDRVIDPMRSMNNQESWILKSFRCADVDQNAITQMLAPLCHDPTVLGPTGLGTGFETELLCRLAKSDR